MSKSGSLSSTLLSLPWIVRLLIVIFADFIYGVARLLDGIAQKNVLKIIVGFLWIFYGLGIGYVLDIICTLFNIKPILM